MDPKLLWAQFLAWSMFRSSRLAKDRLIHTSHREPVGGLVLPSHPWRRELEEVLEVLVRVIAWHHGVQPLSPGVRPIVQHQRTPAGRLALRDDLFGDQRAQRRVEALVVRAPDGVVPLGRRHQRLPRTGPIIHADPPRGRSFNHRVDDERVIGTGQQGAYPVILRLPELVDRDGPASLCYGSCLRVTVRDADRPAPSFSQWRFVTPSPRSF